MFIRIDKGEFMGDNYILNAKMFGDNLFCNKGTLNKIFYNRVT